MEKTTLNVNGMSCGHCVNAVTKAVKALAGVGEVAVSLEKKTATVEYDPAQITVDQIKAAITGEGYQAA